MRDITAAVGATRRPRALLRALDRSAGHDRFRPAACSARQQQLPAHHGLHRAKILDQSHSLFCGPDLRAHGGLPQFLGGPERRQAQRRAWQRVGHTVPHRIEAAYSPILDADGRPFKGRQVRHRRDGRGRAPGPRVAEQVSAWELDRLRPSPPLPEGSAVARDGSVSSLNQPRKAWACSTAATTLHPGRAKRSADINEIVRDHRPDRQPDSFRLPSTAISAARAT